jgi:hypothetical protein
VHAFEGERAYGLGNGTLGVAGGVIELRIVHHFTGSNSVNQYCDFE